MSIQPNKDRTTKPPKGKKIKHSCSEDIYKITPWIKEIFNSIPSCKSKKVVVIIKGSSVGISEQIHVK